VPCPKDHDELEEDGDDNAGEALDNRELPDESDMDDSDDPDVVDCPYCRKTISEEAEWCHHCGNYLSREDAPRRVPLWVFAVAVFAALAALMWVMR